MVPFGNCYLFKMVLICYLSLITTFLHIANNNEIEVFGNWHFPVIGTFLKCSNVHFYNWYHLVIDGHIFSSGTYLPLMRFTIDN